MQPRSGGKKKKYLKMPSLWSHFKKPHSLIDSATSRQNNVQSSNLLKISNMPNFSVNTVSSVKDNLQTAKFLSDLNEPENLMKFAIRFVKDYMRTKNKPSAKRNFSIGVASSVEDNLQSQSLSNKPHPSLKYGVQPPTATKRHLNEKKLTLKKILKPILHTNSSDEICSNDEAYSIFYPMSSKKPPKKDRNKLPPMVLRIYKWHWQSKKMFQCAFSLSKHANKLISGNIFHMLILYVFRFFFIIVKIRSIVNSQKFIIPKSVNF